MPGIAVYRLSITTSTAPVITPHRKDTCDISLPRDDRTQETPQVVIGNNITADANIVIVSPTSASWNLSKLEINIRGNGVFIPAMPHPEVEFWLTDGTAPVGPNSFLDGSAPFYNPLSRLTLPHWLRCRTFVRKCPRRSLPFPIQYSLGTSRPKGCLLL